MINLLPHKIKESRKYGRRNRSMLGYSMLLFVTALGTAGIMAGSLQFIGADESDLRKDIATAESKISELESEVKATEQIATRLETAKKIQELSISFSDLIPEIGAVLPEGSILNSLSLSGSGATAPLELNVELANSSLAPVLVRNLVESELFEAADILSLTPKSSGDDDEGVLYAFSATVTASFTGTEEARQKALSSAKAKADAAAAAAVEATQ